MGRGKLRQYAQMEAERAQTSQPGSQTSAPKEGCIGTLVVLGDSIGAMQGIDRGKGWVNMVAHTCAPQLEVVNWSQGGITAAAVAANLPHINTRLQQAKPAFVVIELGANDRLFGMSSDAICDRYGSNLWCPRFTRR